MSAIRVLVAIIEMGGFRLFFYHIVSCGQIMCLLCVLCYWDVDGFLLLRVFALGLVRVEITDTYWKLNRLLFVSKLLVHKTQRV